MSDTPDLTGVVYCGPLGAVDLPGYGPASVDGKPLLVPQDVATTLIANGDWEPAPREPQNPTTPNAPKDPPVPAKTTGFAGEKE